MHPLYKKFDYFFQNKSGATFMEYGLGFALLVGATAASMKTMNENIEYSYFCNTPDQRNVNSQECADFRSTYQQDRADTEEEAREQRLNNNGNNWTQGAVNQANGWTPPNNQNDDDDDDDDDDDG